MKKAVLALLLLFTLSLVTVSCRDTKTEEKGDVEEAVENAGDEMENAAEETGDAIENAAEETEDAVEEGVNEVEENTGTGGTDDN